MPDGTVVRRRRFGEIELRRAQAGAAQQIEQQEQAARSQIEQARQQAEAQRQVIESRRQQLQSAAVVRGVPLRQRQEAAERLSVAGREIEAGLTRVEQVERQIQQQATSARERVREQIGRAREEFIGGVIPEGELQIPTGFVPISTIEGVKLIEIETGQISEVPQVTLTPGEKLFRDLGIQITPREEVLQKLGITTDVPTFQQIRELEQQQLDIGILDIPIVTGVSPEFEVPRRETIGGRPIIFPEREEELTLRQLLTAPLGVAREVGAVTAFGVGGTAGILGVPDVTQIIPPEPVPQRVTIGGEFVFPEREVTLISPEEIGKIAGLGAELGVLAATPTSLLGAAFFTEGATELFRKPIPPPKFNIEQLSGTFELESGETIVNPFVVKTEVGDVVNISKDISGANLFISEQLRTEEEFGLGRKLIGGIEVGLGVTLLGRSLLKPKLFVGGKPVTKFTVVQTELPIIKDGVEIRAGKFTLVGETPPRQFAVQSNLGRVFFRPDIFTLGETDFRIAIGKITGKGGTFSGTLSTRRQGATLTNVFDIAGGSQKLNILDLSALTPLEKRLLLEKVGREGVVLAPEGTKFFRAGVEVRKRFRISRTPQGDLIVITPKPGTATGRFASVTAIREIPTGSTTAKLFQTASGSADITFSATGRRTLSRIEGAVKVEDPLILESETKFIKRTGRPRTIQELQQKQAIVELKSAETSARRILQQQASARASRLPSPLKSLNRPAVIPKGTVAPLINTQTTQQVNLKTINKFSTALKEAPALSQDEKQVILQQSRQLLKQFEVAREKELALTGFAQPQAMKSRQLQKQIIIQLTKQTQLEKLMQKQELRQVAILEGRPRPTPRVPRVPLKPLIPIPKGNGATATLRSALRKIRGGLDVVIKRGGKPVTIAINLPKNKAVKTGRDFVSRNIAASFKLVSSGKKARGEDIKPVSLGGTFRLSKKDPLFVVEKRKFRLDSPLEVSQIQRARRK